MARGDLDECIAAAPCPTDGVAHAGGKPSKVAEIRRPESDDPGSLGGRWSRALSLARKCAYASACMAAWSTTRKRSAAMLAAALLLLVPGTALSQILPWEVTVAEVEAGRLRNLAERLNKQYLLYQLRLGEVRKDDVIDTATQIDRLIEALERGTPAHSIPSAWNDALRSRIIKVDTACGPLRKIAVATPYELMRVSRQFVPAASRRGDPLLLLYFDDLTEEFVSESENLLSAYNDECEKTGIEVCPAARNAGYAAMLIERATKEAIYIVADIDAKQNRKRLNASILEYQTMQKANDESPFFSAALQPDRGISARAAGELLQSLRVDWKGMQGELTILAAGDEENFDLRRLLAAQNRLVEKVERLTAALVRFASLTYGS
jgi:hypothetical protein